MDFRTEYPKPQFERENWRCLNGEWQFSIDHGDSGEPRGYQSPDLTADKVAAIYDKTIRVPFCPESSLSGVEYKDFMSAVWYRRKITVSEKELAGRIVLHFGACDFITTVWINGRYVGDHKGGYVSFSFDVTEFLTAGDNLLVVRARDNTRDPLIPRGKQSEEFFSHGCDYTRTTGIWQSVWLEFTPVTYIENFRVEPDLDTQSVNLEVRLHGAADLKVEASFEGKPMGKAALKNASGTLHLCLPLSEAHLWEIGAGRLYDLIFTFGDDRVKSYFGLRKIEYRDKKFFLNGKSVFQRLVLDQGFYPDGIYTAPSDAELLADVKRSQAMGFNGARLHQKVFEERFLYHCDREGYIVWGEYPNWGLDHTNPVAVYSILDEWLDEVERDRNHPSIVGWCPFNETWDQHGAWQCDDVLEAVWRATKAADPTRPCIDTSGNFHVKNITDIYDVHDYEQDPAKYAANFGTLGTDGQYKDRFEPRQKYLADKPFFVSEYGGIAWTNDAKGWGYGNAPKTPEEFLARLKGLTDVMLDNPNIFAYCYTQLTNVEQEQNGLYTYDRQPKFPPEVISAIFGRKAKVEE